MILFNNKEILVGGKPIFISEWLNSNILFIQDLLNSNGHFMSYQEFRNKYACKTNFLQFYQVLSAIPKHLATKAKNTVPPEGEPYIENSPLFQLDDLITIHLDQAKTKDFYCLLNKKTHTRCQTGPTKWDQTMQLDGEAWKKIFNWLKNTCKGTKLKEFQFKLIYRIVVTKKELFRYGIKTDDECLCCSEHDSIDHTFVDCEFVKNFVKNVINWFNAVNNSNFTPTMDEKVFGIMSGPYDKTLLKRFNYTTLYMRYYIYTCKMQNKAIHLPVFVSKVLYKYGLENLS